MSLADELYRETILDHYHNPRNQGSLENHSACVEGVNPLCGDELKLYLLIENDRIADVKLESRGCSINTASGSMMSELIMHKSLAEAQTIIDTFKNMMLGNENELLLSEELEELEALQGVKKYPVRIKCALLPWNTLIEGIEQAGTADNGAIA